MKKSIKKVALSAALVLGLSLPVAIGASVTLERNQAQMQAENLEESIAVVAVLRQGSKGGEVKEVQRRLKLWDIIKVASTVFSAQVRVRR